MKNRLKIQGFKCIKDMCLELNNMSVLVGSNSAGKSSIIQSLLLLTDACKPHDTNNLEALPTHNIMGVDLGKVDNLFYDDKSFLKDSNFSNDITISIDDFCARIPFSVNGEDNEHSILLQCDQIGSPLGSVHYLDAERLGPRYVCEFKDVNTDNCGIHGENTAYVWEMHSGDKVSESKRLTPSQEGNFAIQLADWIKFIFDDLSLHVKKLYDRALQIQVANHKEGTTMLHIGFGVSYALPILVEGLLLKANDTLIVENPEAHLQPKAQTRMGFFLAVMAASGVRVIVETHSEHIINGIIKSSTTESVNLNEADISIYYINHKDQENPRHISISDARENRYPDDFFDNSADILNQQIHNREVCIKAS